MVSVRHTEHPGRLVITAEGVKSIADVGNLDVREDVVRFLAAGRLCDVNLGRPAIDVSTCKARFKNGCLVLTWQTGHGEACHEHSKSEIDKGKSNGENGSKELSRSVHLPLRDCLDWALRQLRTLEALWQEKPKEQLRVLTSVKTEDSGVAGDRYKVQLHVAGRWRAVHWSKLSEGADAVETLEDGSTPELPAALLATAPVEDSGIYYVVAGWNMWSFSQKMSKDGGVHSLEVKLLWDGGDFQIVRDGDWTQAFHPAVPGALDGSSVVGPDDYLHGMNWCLDAKAGDVFRIELQRTFTDGEESRALSWAKLRHEGLTREERKEARTPSYYLVGSMEMGREQKLKMEWDQERMLFAANFEIGRSGEEWFAILWNGDWSWRIYPSRPDAYPGEECKHRVLGPDDEGSGLFWKISEASGDEDAAGESYEVQLHVGPNGQPTKVEWTRL